MPVVARPKRGKSNSRRGAVVINCFLFIAPLSWRLYMNGKCETGVGFLALPLCVAWPSAISVHSTDPLCSKSTSYMLSLSLGLNCDWKEMYVLVGFLINKLFCGASFGPLKVNLITHFNYKTAFIFIHFNYMRFCAVKTDFLQSTIIMNFNVRIVNGIFSYHWEFLY